MWRAIMWVNAECQIAQLKEIKERNRRIGFGMDGTEVILLNTKSIVGLNKGGKSRPEIF